MSTGEIKTPVIFVSYDKEANDLIFEDNQGHKGKFITTSVWRKLPVLWKVANGEDIVIEKIYPKDGSQNILEGQGPLLDDDGFWRGFVKADAKGKEAYNVDYTLNGNSFTADPELDVQPPPPPTNG